MHKTSKSIRKICSMCGATRLKSFRNFPSKHNVLHIYEDESSSGKAIICGGCHSLLSKKEKETKAQFDQFVKCWREEQFAKLKLNNNAHAYQPESQSVNVVPNWSQPQLRKRFYSLYEALTRLSGNGNEEYLLNQFLQSKFALKNFSTLFQQFQLDFNQSQLVQNVEDFFENLQGKNFHFKKCFVKYFCKNISDMNFVAKLTGLSIETCRKYIKETTDTTIDNELFCSYAKGVTRTSIEGQRLQQTINFIKSYCPTKSGYYKELYLQFMTDKELYSSYLGFIDSYNASIITQAEKIEALCSITFSKIKNTLPFKRVTKFWGHFDCPVCQKLPKYKAELQQLVVQPLAMRKSEKIQWLEKQIEEIENHQKIAEIQRKAQQRQREQLKEGEAIIIQDFTTFYPDTGSISKIQDLVMVMEWKNSNNEIDRWYFDGLCSDKNTLKNDSGYVINVWKHLLEETDIFDGINKIFIWSDGGSKHFKNKTTQYYFSTIESEYRENLQVEYNFYVSYHGHNLCDSHAAKDKQALRQYTLSHYRAPVDADELCDVLVDKNSMTHPYVLDKIDRNINEVRESCRAKSFPKGIKKFHSFQYLNRGMVLCKIRTTDTDGIIQQIVLIPDENEMEEDEL